MSLAKALQSLKVTGWSIIGEEIYSNIKWGSEVIPESIVNKKIAELESIKKPREIDARRLRLALLQLNLLDKVEAAISTLGRAAIVDWEYATIIKEDYPLVQALSNNLGLDIQLIFDTAENII